MAARNGFQPGGDIFPDGGDSGRFIQDDIANVTLGVNASSFAKVQATDDTQPSGYATWVNSDGSDVGRPDTATGESVIIKKWTSFESSDSMPAPVFVDIAPAIGDVLGQTLVTVTLVDAVNLDTVKVGGVPLTGLAITSPTTVTGLTGPHAAGLVDIEVVNAGGSDSAPDVFTYVQSTPVISVTPNTGDEAGGTVTVVEVADSALVTAIYFGSALGTALSVIDATHVQVTTPATAPGAVDVSANVPNAVNRLQGGFTFRYTLSLAPQYAWKYDETSGVVAAPVFGGVSGTHGTNVSVNVAGKLSRAVDYPQTVPAQCRTIFAGGDVNFLNLERTQPFSISCWIKTNSAPVNTMILGRILRSAPFTGWGIRLFSGSFALDLISNFGAGQTIRKTTNIGSLANNAWRHVVATYDGSSTLAGIVLYVDGVAVATTTSGALSASIQQTTVPLTQGGNSEGDNDWRFPGSVDDMAFFNGVLTAADVAKIYARANAGSSIAFSAGPAGAYTNISPNACSTLGNVAVTVTLTSTAGIVDVKLGGVSLTSLQVTSDTTVTGVTGARAAGMVDVDVYYSNGTISTGVAAFTYVTSTPVVAVTPNEGDEAGNTLVTVTVGNSSLVNSVYFGGTIATNLTIVDGTHVQCRTPAKTPQRANVTVNVANASEGLANGFTFTYDISAQPTNVWQLDETSGTAVADTGNPGGIAGVHQSAVLVNEAGQVGRAARYNNTGATNMTGRTAFGNVFAFERTQAFSACGWVKSSATGNAPILGNMRPSNPYTGWIVENIAGGAQLDFYLISNYFSPNMLWIRGTGVNFQDGTWKHWAVTYDGSSTPGGVKLYGNGAPLAMATISNTLVGSIIDAANRFNFASRSNDIISDYGPWPGWQDDNALFIGTVLTAADIAKIYAEGVAGASVRFGR